MRDYAGIRIMGVRARAQVCVHVCVCLFICMCLRVSVDPAL